MSRRFTAIIALLILSVLVSSLPSSARRVPPKPTRPKPAAAKPVSALGLREHDDDFTTFTTPLPRTTVDRPDDSTEPSVKVLYVVPTWATDRQRDTNGEIARSIFAQNEWLASQNGGFGVRLDTFNGALDIGFVRLDVTKDVWASWFDVNLGPAVEMLQQLGWPVESIGESNGDELYYVIWEAFAGNYRLTGRGAGSCRPTIDPTNAGFLAGGIATSMLNGTPCPLKADRFPFRGDASAQRAWFGSGLTPFVDHSVQMMRGLPGCRRGESPRDGDPYFIPNDSGEIGTRRGFIRDLLPPHDPLAMRMPSVTDGSRPILDQDHWVYFHITNDRLARTDCNSDASRHPIWDNRPLDRNGYRTLLRSSYDRPDDFTGPQVHVIYAVKNRTADRQFDTNGLIERAIEHMDRWLFEQSGGIGVRFDTYQGRLDVTYFPVPADISSVNAPNCLAPCPSEVDILNQYKAAGRFVEGKQYIVFYDGGIVYKSGPGLCGGSLSNSAGSFINLDHAIGRTCSSIPWFGFKTSDWSIGLLALHEMFHALGVVFHSSDPTDLMHGSAGNGSRLDPGRDDYWGNTSGPYPDLSKSPLFTLKASPFDSPFPW